MEAEVKTEVVAEAVPEAAVAEPLSAGGLVRKVSQAADFLDAVSGLFGTISPDAKELAQKAELLTRAVGQKLVEVKGKYEEAVEKLERADLLGESMDAAGFVACALKQAELAKSKR